MSLVCFNLKFWDILCTWRCVTNASKPGDHVDQRPRKNITVKFQFYIRKFKQTNDVKPLWMESWNVMVKFFGDTVSSVIGYHENNTRPNVGMVLACCLVTYVNA